MRLAKVGLFVLLVGFGATVEVAWQIREHAGSAGWRIFRGRFEGPSHTFTTPARTVPMPAVTTVEVTNEFGSIDVVAGAPGEARIVLRTVVYEADEARARKLGERIQLSSEVAGGVLRVGTNRRDFEAPRSDGPQVGIVMPREFGHTGVETHLELQVPPGTGARIRNAHGPTSVADAAWVDVESRFDRVEIQRVGGDARVVAGHADVVVAGVKGALDLKARHGDVTVRDLAGAGVVELEHGNGEFERTAGLQLTTRHAEVRATGLSGPLQLNGGHTALEARGLAAGATVTTSYDDVTIEDVTGDVAVTTEHGGVVLRDVRGGARVQSRYDEVELARIAGPVDVVSANGPVRASDLKQGGTFRLTGRDLEIDGFAGAVHVTGERSAARLVSHTPLSGPLTVATSQDPVRLELPAGAPLDLEASAPHGDVDVQVAGFQASETAGNRVVGRLGEGGPLVRLSSERGSVEVVSR